MNYKLSLLDLGTLLLIFFVLLRVVGFLDLSVYLPGDFDLWISAWLGLLLYLNVEFIFTSRLSFYGSRVVIVGVILLVGGLLVDGFQYQGYLVDTHGVEPASLVWIVGLGAMLSIVHLCLSCRHSSVHILLIVALFYLISGNFYTSSWIWGRRLQFNAGQTMQTHDAKMRAVWDDFYDYTQFINEIVAEDDVILHPPQENPWQRVGNQLTLRYFVYPRRLLQATNETFRDRLTVSDWVIISDGTPRVYPSTGLYGWPQYPVPIDSVHVFQKIPVSVQVNSVSSVDSKGSEKFISIDESTFTLASDLEVIQIPIDSESGSITVLGESNRSYTISLVAIGERDSVPVEIEGASNVYDQLWYEEMQPFEISFDISDAKIRLEDLDAKFTRLELRVTNKLPLLYLYKKGLAHIAQDQLPIVAFTNESMINLGDQALMNSDLEAAEAFYTQALLMKEDALGALMGMYWISMERNDIVSAREYLIRAEPLLPEDLHLNIATQLLTND